MKTKRKLRAKVAWIRVIRSFAETAPEYINIETEVLRNAKMAGCTERRRVRFCL